MHVLGYFSSEGFLPTVCTLMHEDVCVPAETKKPHFRADFSERAQNREWAEKEERYRWRGKEAGREAEEVSFREIKLISLSLCRGWYFSSVTEVHPHPDTIAATTLTTMSVSGWPWHSPAGDNRLNLFHFMPQAPKYNPCGAPPGPAAPLCPLPPGPPPWVESWQRLPQSTGLSCWDGGLRDYRPSEEITVCVCVKECVCDG